MRRYRLWKPPNPQSLSPRWGAREDAACDLFLPPERGKVARRAERGLSKGGKKGVFP